MTGRERFEANGDVIDRAIARVCHDAGLRGADADDFASNVKLALISNDYAIAAKFQERSSFATYITIVIRRLLIEEHRAEGRWHPSADARRGGEAALLLERLLWRDRREREEALDVAAREHPELTRAQLEEIADGLAPRAPRRRLVSLDDVPDIAAPSGADDQALSADAARRAAEAGRIVRETMASMSVQDRMILRLRYAEGNSISEVARALGIAQRPLYRRIEALLAQLRRALQRAGVRADAVGDLIGRPDAELDFGFENGKRDGAQPS
jgi:RNA polymerase sigma factor (sigma-70 family)